MITLFSLSLAIGVLGLILWIAGSAASGMVSTWDRLDPEVRVGRWGRMALAFLLGFGMGGISASFAGLSSALALVAAIAGGGALVAVSVVLGPEAGDTGSES